MKNYCVFFEKEGVFPEMTNTSKQEDVGKVASFLVHLIYSFSKLVAYDFLFSPLVHLALMSADYLGTAALIDGV